MMRFLFSGKGRVSRKDIWLFYIALIVASIVAGILDLVFFTSIMLASDTGPLSAGLSIISIWPGIAISAKRFHDRGMSGWWVLWFLLITAAALIPGGVIMATMDTQGLALGATLMLLGVAIPQIWQFVILMILPGKPGPNQYGPNPLDPAGAELKETFS